MFDRARLVELVESAIDAHPCCPACDAAVEVVDADGALVLRCSNAASATSVLGRIGAVVFPHLRQVIVAREDLLAA
jgi:hypothetical protein